MEGYTAGTMAGAGSFVCEDCGYAIALHELDRVPHCPSCESERFRRAPMFARDTETHPAAGGHPEPPGWLAEARDALVTPGSYLAFERDDRTHVIPLQEGWTRLGRSLSAHVRFDDPTVSRRHALVHREGHEVKVLDDRSLNGLFVNGEQVDMRDLSDGDEVGVGRFRLFLLSLTSVGAGVR